MLVGQNGGRLSSQYGGRRLIEGNNFFFLDSDFYLFLFIYLIKIKIKITFFLNSNFFLFFMLRIERSIAIIFST